MDGVVTARRFASLEEVAVPAGVAPGSRFTVLLAPRGKGQAAAVRKDCWSGSGAAPIIVPRQAQAVAGKRHRLRPSAQAGTRRELIDNMATQTVDIACWSSTEQMPFEV